MRNMRPFILLAAALLSTANGYDMKYCTQGWSFEKSCLSMPYPTAYVDGEKGRPSQCVIAIEDSDATASTAQNYCDRIGTFVQGQRAQAFDASSVQNAAAKLEKYFAIKQSGFYFAGREMIVPSSGKNRNAQGYLCTIRDRFGCEKEWSRFGSSCYKEFTIASTFDTAVGACADSGATLPRIMNDEENKFVAMLAREKIFKDALGKNEIWGPLHYSDGEWANAADSGKNERNVAYMRWWSTDKGIYPVVNNPDQYDASTIFTGRNDKDRTAYFGYWGTAKKSDKKAFICKRPLNELN